jgi:hypothetical protein
VHHSRARERRILLVQGDDAAGQALVLQRLAQHPRRDDRLAVVGEADRAGVPQLGHLGELASLQPTSDRREEPGGDPRLRVCLGYKRLHDRRGVHRRARVRHRDHGAVAAGGGRRGPAGDVLLVLLTGGAQMHVRVDERREQVGAAGVDGVDAGRCGEAVRGTELRDLPITDEHVMGTVEAGTRVGHVSGANEQLRRRPRRGVQLEGGIGAGHQATAIRLGDPTSSS